MPQGQVDFRVVLEYVDSKGAMQEQILSSATPSATIQASASPGASLSIGAEEIGVDHTLPYGCQLTHPDGTQSDCSAYFFSTIKRKQQNQASGTYTFSFTYGGQVYARTLNATFQ